jgi:FAD synthetase
MKVMVFGTFDILHFGHIRLFEQAKKYGSSLTVVVGRDANVLRVKGHKPFHSEKERVGLLRHVDIIDEVLLGHKNDVYRIINEVRPDIIALGYDQKIFVDKLGAKIKEYGLNIKIVRLRPFRNTTHKSSKIRQYINEL